MKKNLYAFLLLFLSILFFAAKTFAQRESGGFSEGHDPVFEQKISNYPNSFSNYTSIKYEVPAEGEIIIKIYNAPGQEITTLVQGNFKAGSYTIGFNSSKILPGIYVCKYSFLVDKKVSVLTRKLLVIK